MIKSVIFDVDGVLFDSFEANLKFYQDLLSHAGYKPPAKKVFSKMFHMTMTDVIRLLTKTADEQEVKRIWLMGKHREVPYPNNLLIFPNYLDKVMKELKNQYILGIVTSRIRGGIFKIPELAKYENYFSTVVYYEDTVKHKPDPEPLLLAANRLGINPWDAVYIGDTESDIKAAKNAGMKILIYAKNKLANADLYTSEFSKITELIKTL